MNLEEAQKSMSEAIKAIQADGTLKVRGPVVIYMTTPQEVSVDPEEPKPEEEN